MELFVCEADGDPVEGGGLESYGEHTLLRSIVVDPDHRGEGYGSVIIEEFGERAREGDAERAYLLTTTAAEFFRTSGFETVEHDAVPESICGTAQFRELCPANATCMERDLEPVGGQ